MFENSVAGKVEKLRTELIKKGYKTEALDIALLFSFSNKLVDIVFPDKSIYLPQLFLPNKPVCNKREGLRKELYNEMIKPYETIDFKT